MGFGHTPGTCAQNVKLLTGERGRLPQALSDARNTRFHNDRRLRALELTERIGLPRDQARFARGCRRQHR